MLLSVPCKQPCHQLNPECFATMMSLKRYSLLQWHATYITSPIG